MKFADSPFRYVTAFDTSLRLTSIYIYIDTYLKKRKKKRKLDKTQRTETPHYRQNCPTTKKVCVGEDEFVLFLINAKDYYL